MILSSRKLRRGRRAGEEQPGGESLREIGLMIPNHFRCPISLELMKDPVTLSTGITYDRVSIEKLIHENGNVTCPITNQVLTSLEPIPNHTIRKMIQDWCVENRSHGLDPVSSAEVLEIPTTCKREEQVGCAAAFEFLSETCNLDEHVSVLEEALLTLTSLFPLHGEALTYLESASSMRCLVWFLKSGDLSRRRNAVLVLRELVSSDHSKVNMLSEIEGATEELFKLIREPICPTATKASLVVVYHTITSASANEKLIQKFADMGLVSLLLEILIDGQRSVCEKAMSVFDGICSSDYGRGEAYANSLTMPVIVKKMLRVSDLATESSVSILWKLCKDEKKEESFFCGSASNRCFSEAIIDFASWL